jgi:RND family efflux transporter MFP subunit
MDRSGGVMKRWSSALLQITLVVIIVFAGIIITKKLITTKPKIKKVRHKEITHTVKVERVTPESVKIIVNGDGTVSPSKKIDIVPQVAGKAIYVSERFQRGGRFREGELLVKIEDSDYLAALARAEADLKAQEARLIQLKEESEEAKREWQDLNPGTEPPPLLIKLPEIEAAEAAIEAARASIERARLDLQRTEIRAPFSGVVLQENLDTGQYLRAGQSVGQIFSDEKAEVRVYLNERDVGYIEIPGFNTESETGSSALIETDIGGKSYKWTGYVVRAEPVDEKTRTIPVVVVVNNPYGTLPPLSVGSFVRVKIMGKVLDEATLIQKEAVQWTEAGLPFVWVVGEEYRLKKRMVNIEKSINGRYIVTKVLKSGEQVVITPPPSVTEGMKVRIEDIRD